jgi:mannose-6-phosphate isomerase-like protein (cupin superfamily)
MAVSGTTIRRTDGESITDRPNREVRILLAGDPALTVTWSRYGEGERGPDLHVHRRHTDAFFIVSGALTFTLGAGGERTEHAPAGTVVVVPPDVPHAFVNRETPDAVFLNVHTPDEGFAAYMRDLRDGRPASFDSLDLPVDGTAPAADAVIAAGRYEGAELQIAAGPDGVTIAVAGARDGAVTFVDG